ncbi:MULTISPECIES: extracellular solute-binding protein [unclassified Modicisalibacter]|uniref:extracellular solute-binding protein n=1 Tax=unclassified Modicisalibacter TaxID=2679913 RepID=UPI001CCB2C7D|nr:MULTISPECIES: extracellular solute-binding protein [unclassified Modicisalibacter]MBZ9556714.1 ABC transporter substrate-binding protein [Modicisalibacter sp. R2A 31.J]MBZ9574817.1 ABC transporter substrate-binding protein [Modicisalibacter sp. MOD 31.J]
MLRNALAALLTASALVASPLALAADPGEVPTVSGLSLYDRPELGDDFAHFPYVDPKAPKGGTLARAAYGSFDSTNPFIVKGTPASGLTEVYDTLMVSNPDEPFSMYGLLASGVRLDPQRRWIEFDINPKARFHDGTPVTAEDVAFSFRLLRDEGSPFYASYYADVTSVQTVDADTVRFDFAEHNSRELPLILGQLPVLPKHYWQDRDFTRPTLDAPLGSGPYRVARIEPGRRIVYQRVDDYWGKDLPVNRGRHNIDKLIFDYYRDQSVALEAFKAGNLDMRIESSARNWATAYDFPAANQGFVDKLMIPDGQPAGMQGYVMNLRRDKFKDVRVREALSLAFYFPWLNDNLFYGAYQRTHSYFENSPMAASGEPGPGELELLEPYRDQLPESVFDAPLPIDEPADLRPRLRKALGLLRDAGYEIQNGQLVDRKTGQPFTLEVLLHDTQFERIVQPLLKNLARIGIDGRIRTVDVNQYLNRLRSFDYDMIVGSFPQSSNPGNEQREYWTSEYADKPQSRNLIGLEDPVIDALVDDLIRADSRQSLNTAAQALDRVLRWGFYVIPQWHLDKTRIAVWDKFGRPQPPPRYTPDLDAWWVDPQRAKTIDNRQHGE